MWTGMYQRWRQAIICTSSGTSPGSTWTTWRRKSLTLSYHSYQTDSPGVCSWRWWTAARSRNPRSRGKTIGRWALSFWWGGYTGSRGKGGRCLTYDTFTAHFSLCRVIGDPIDIQTVGAIRGNAKQRHWLGARLRVEWLIGWQVGNWILAIVLRRGRNFVGVVIVLWYVGTSGNCVVHHWSVRHFKIYNRPNINIKRDFLI